MTEQCHSLTSNQRYWLNHYQQWQRSAMTAVQYCDQYGIDASAFSSGRRRLRELSVIVVNDDRTRARFTRISVESIVNEPLTSTLYMSNGHRLELPIQALTPAFLAQLCQLP